MSCCQHCDNLEIERLKSELAAVCEDRDVAFERRDGLKHQLRVRTMERDAAMMTSHTAIYTLGKDESPSRAHTLLGHDFNFWLDRLYEWEANGGSTTDSTGSPRRAEPDS